MNERLQPQGESANLTEGRESIVRVASGTMVFLEYGGGGVVRQDFSANRLKWKVRGLSGFEAKEGFSTYLNGRIRTLRAHTNFGMYAKNAHEERKLPG